jgi:hypothetical protein
MRVLALIMLGKLLEKISRTQKDNLGYQKLNENKPWLDDECSKLIDQLKQAKLRWLQNPSQIMEIIFKI